MNYVFYFLYPKALMSGEIALLGVDQFLQIVNYLPKSILFKYKPTNPEPTHNQHLYWSVTL